LTEVTIPENRIKLSLRSAVSWVGMAIVTLALTPPVTILAPFSRPASRRLLQMTTKALLWIAGAKLEVRNQSGSDEIPVGAVFVSNHASYLDVLSLLTAIKGGFRFLAKRTLLFLPGVNLVLLGQGHIFASKSRPLKTLKNLKRRVPEILEKGDRLVIFPEGRRSPDGEVKEFQDGAAAMAIWSKAPLIPIAIIGAREILPFGNWPVRPGKITMVIGPPIATDELTVRDRKRLTSQAKDWIIETIRETRSEK